MVVRIAVYCAQADRSLFEVGLERHGQAHETVIRGQFFFEFSDFLNVLRDDSSWDLVVVAVPGARGMEAVYNAREWMPEVPILWCSDDADFAVASYRLRCRLFLTLPLQEEHVQNALERCLAASNAYEIA